MNGQLPRLLLVSDEPIGFGGRGSTEALLRLFQEYPQDRLMIAQTQGLLPEAQSRIGCQDYRSWSLPWDRLLRTRLTVPANIMKVVHHRYAFRYYADAAKAAAPDAIVTLVHANGWILARRIAERLQIPLHLIVHDGPDHFHLTYPLTGSFMRKEFERACRQASSRWSICTALDQYIEQITGVPGNVLSPLRSADDKPLSVKVAGAPANQAVFFGALVSVSTTEMINAAASQLARFGGALHAYGGISPKVAASAAWKNRTFIHHGPFTDRNEFLRFCQRSYGLMYLPFPFDDIETRFSFPSKIVDYTLTGLPILVQAPPSSPLGKWCSEHPGAAIFVRELGPQAIEASIKALLESAEMRARYAIGALNAGECEFGFERNWKRFIATLSGRDSRLDKKS